MVVDVDLNEITDDRELEFFFDDKVRKVWHKQEEEWCFSIYDVVSVLSESQNPKEYIKKCENVTLNFLRTGGLFVPQFE